MAVPESDLAFRDTVTHYVANPRYLRRDWLATIVEERMWQPECRFLLLTAEPGAGKSTFVAQLAHDHPAWPVYFIRRDQRTPLSDGGAHSFLQRIGFQLAATYPQAFQPQQLRIAINQRIGDASSQVIAAEVDRILASPFYETVITIQQEVGRSAEKAIGLKASEMVVDPRLVPVADLQYMALIDPALALQALDPSARVVLLLDALDELRYATTQDTLIDWLSSCPELPENVRILVTSRPDPAWLAEFRGRQQPWLIEESIPDSGPHALADVQDYASRMARDQALRPQLPDEASRDSFVRLAVEKAEGNLGYLDAIGRALDQAAAQNDAHLLADLIAFKHLPRSLDALYAHFLTLIWRGISGLSVQVRDPVTRERHNLPAWPAVYRPILGVLAVAREPLSLPQIRRLGGIGAEAGYVAGALGRLRQFLDQVNGGYRLYHATLPEFLTSAVTHETPELQEFAIDPLDWHQEIVEAYGGVPPNWGNVNWPDTDDYALGQLVGHLHPLRKIPRFSQALHQLVHQEPFRRERNARWHRPATMLDDILLALDVAMETADLAQCWRHIRLYRHLLHEEREFQHVGERVTGGDFEAALARTSLLVDRPNTQALVRLWIAWSAALAGNWDAALDASRLALDRLPPGGIITGTVIEVDDGAAGSISDAIHEALIRLLLRIVRLLPSTQSQPAWLASAARSWPTDDLARFTARLGQPLAAWGDSFDAASNQAPIPRLLDELKTRAIGADQFGNFREASFYYQRILAAALFNSRSQGEAWGKYVAQAVELIALDDYPSYREMALAWIAAAVLAQEDDHAALQALATVLRGMMQTSATGFWGDTVAAAVEGYGQEKGEPFAAEWLHYYVQDREASGLKDMDPTIHRKSEELLAWRRQVGLPPDPWAHQIRQVSAVASILRRRGDEANAEAWLAPLETYDPRRSYAGFRTQARLSLACRWLEWGQPHQARLQVAAAREDAHHMLDQVLKTGRLALVDMMETWLDDYPDNPGNRPSGAAVRHANELPGLTGALYLEYLSALWSGQTDLLRQLLPLALHDAATADAIFGRWLATQARQPRSGLPFTALVRELGIAG